MANKLEIIIGEFHDCKTVEPDQTGFYVVLYGRVFPSIPKEKAFNISVWSFVVGHGWNCSVRDDGTVIDKYKIEISQPTYWAPLTIIERPDDDDDPDPEEKDDDR